VTQDLIHRSIIDALLAEMIPFRFLAPETRRELGDLMSVVTFPQGRWILREGDVDDRCVYLVAEGTLDIVDETNGELETSIGRGRYFGERAALFGTPRARGVLATSDVTLATLNHETFLEYLHSSPALAHALGSILRERQGLFRAFDAFMATLLVGISDETVNVRQLRARYLELEPALHAKARDPHVIDFDALSYALPRLPDGVTNVFMFHLTDTLDSRYVAPLAQFRQVETAARRRSVYEMAPGKYMVMLRDGVSDLVDFVTCLCSLATESQKLRHRMMTEERMALAASLCTQHPQDDAARDEALQQLGFTQHECEQLVALFGDEVFETLYGIALHHEDYNLQVSKQLQGYNTQHAEQWTQQVVDAVVEILGEEPSALPADLPVHIVSSNTHSVHNCLSPYLREHAEEIEAWAREAKPEHFEIDWHDDSDRLYSLARGWFKAHPERKAERMERDQQAGMKRLESTALTGIAVELVDLSKVEPEHIDPTILPEGVEPSRDGILVNIDYAFGQQAEEILSILLTLFGRNVRSVNILGKAGALVGDRGDIMVATSFVEQTQDLLEPLPTTNACDLLALSERLPNRNVFVGPVLTVAGTLLQNRVLLNFYKHIWRCVGLEMEGTFYLRELLKAIHLGLVDPEVTMRFVYYVSDVPLEHGETLAGSLRPDEGVPPLYAITREILAGVLTHQRC